MRENGIIVLRDVNELIPIADGTDPRIPLLSYPEPLRELAL